MYSQSTVHSLFHARFVWPRLVEKAPKAPVADESATVDLRWAPTASVFRYMPSRVTQVYKKESRAVYVKNI